MPLWLGVGGGKSMISGFSISGREAAVVADAQLSLCTQLDCLLFYQKESCRAELGRQ